LCPGNGCGKLTGKSRQGVLAVELLQYHVEQEHLEKDKNSNKALIDCECPIHVRLYLICSEKCRENSIYHRVPKPQDIKNYDAELIIPEKGPLLIVQQYLVEIKEPPKESEEGDTEILDTIMYI